MTNAELRERVIRILGLQVDTTSPEVGLVDGWIYEGIVDILARTRPNMRVINLTLTANTAVHDMSQAIISLVDIEDEGGSLDRFSREDIVNLQEFAGRGYAYKEPLLWVSPIPSENKVIKAYGVFRPAKMTGLEDSPSSQNFGGLGAEFHPYIVDYACWKGGEYTEHEGSGLGEKWRVQYEGQDKNGGDLAVMRSTLSKRATPKGSRRRNPLGTVGIVQGPGYYIGG